MRVIKVGELYNPNRTGWAEGSVYEFRQKTHELILFVASPSARIVEAVRSGKCEFALVQTEGALFICYRFGNATGFSQNVGFPWTDAPYQWWLTPEADRALPDPEESDDSRALLTISLVDSQTGILKAFRLVSYSPAFTRALHAAIRAQAATPFPGAMEYYRAVDKVYARFTSTGAMVKLASIRTEGGA